MLSLIAASVLSSVSLPTTERAFMPPPAADHETGQRPVSLTLFFYVSFGDFSF